MTERGHSLVELAVALCLVALLGAGLLGVMGGVVGSLARTRETLGAQRSLRRAQDQMLDDLLEAGFLIPCRTLEPQSRFHLAAGGPGSAELTLLKDQVLPDQARLVAALQPEAPGFPQVAVTGGRVVRLRPGDLLLVEDGAWEPVRVARTVDLLPGRSIQVPVEAPEREPLVRHAHEAGAPVALVRPLRRIHYRLEYLSGGPALVRVETGPGGEVDWAALARRGGREVRTVAQGITGFRVALPRGEGAPVPPLVAVTLEARSRQVTFRCAPRNGPGWAP